MAPSNDQVSGFVVLAMFAVILSLLFLLGFVQEGWKSATIKHGAAEYNATTGAWQWKQPIDPLTGKQAHVQTNP